LDKRATVMTVFIANANADRVTMAGDENILFLVDSDTILHEN
jgi:hypothetical protein